MRFKLNPLSPNGVSPEENNQYVTAGGGSSSGGGGGTWGSITGTLSNQTDLQDALDEKVNNLGAAPNVEIAGDDATSGDAGHIAIYGGIGTAGNANGGDVILAPGSGDGSGTDGTIRLQQSSGAFANADIDLTDLTADRTVTFPDQDIDLTPLWETNDYGADTALEQADSTQYLLIGKPPHSSVYTPFVNPSAMFNGDPNGTNNGGNFFINLAYGTGLAPVGGAFVGGHARGTPSAPTATIAGDWLMVDAAAGHDGTNFVVSGATHVLPGVWHQATAVATGAIERKIYLGGIATPMLSWDSNDNAIKINESLLDADLTIGYDLGTALTLDGATGNTSWSSDMSLAATKRYKINNIDITPRILTVVIDGAGSTITTGAKRVYTSVPYSCKIVKWRILALDGNTGAIVIDVWKDTYANFAPTVADTITASAKPTVTASANKAESSSLTGWTVNLDAGDVLEVNVDSVSTFTKVKLELFVEPR